MTTRAVVLMDEAEARRVTDEVRTRMGEWNGEGLALQARIADMHDREGYKALGYRSWSAYITAEFPTLQRTYSYRLLDLGREQKRIAAEGGNPAEASVRGTARALGKPVDDLYHGDTTSRSSPAPDIHAKLKQKPAKRQMPSLGGKLRELREMIEWLEGAIDGAGDEVFEFMPAADRQDLERTVALAFGWAERMQMRLE